MAPLIKLWELAGDDPQRLFSPFVWRVRLVLFHKQIPYESTVWRYSDKELIKPCQRVRMLLQIPGENSSAVGLSDSRGGRASVCTRLRAAVAQVPVLDYKGQRLNESYDIIKWLDKEFPDVPVLKTGLPAGEADCCPCKHPGRSCGS